MLNLRKSFELFLHVDIDNIFIFKKKKIQDKLLMSYHYVFVVQYFHFKYVK